MDFIKLLGRANIEENDINLILDKINREVYLMLNRNFELYLNRLDYRFDMVIESKDERKILIKLFKKSKMKTAYMKKINKYKNSVRYYSGSRSDNVYDKEIERADKRKKVEKYERNILRFEAQLKSEHIKYNRRKYNIERDLKCYLTHEKYLKYMEKMIINIFTKCDYYNLYNASKIINTSSIKEIYKKELIEFLKYTSQKRSLSKSYERYGRYKYNKYIEVLKMLDINPIIIPEKDKIAHIKNPLKNLK